MFDKTAITAIVKLAEQGESAMALIEKIVDTQTLILEEIKEIREYKKLIKLIEKKLKKTG